MAKILVLLNNIPTGAGNATSLDAESKKIVNVANPTVDGDAANRGWVNTQLAAISFLDGDFRISNTADNTKKIAFSATNIATGTVRTITMPDENVDLSLVSKAVQNDGDSMTGVLAMGTNKITGLGDGGTGTQDAATVNQMEVADGVLQSSINALSAANGMREFCKLITNDASPTEGDTLASVLPFSDDDAPALVEADIAVGNFIIFDADGTPKLGKVYDDTGTKKITFIDVALVNEKLYTVQYNLLAGTAAGETLAIYVYLSATPEMIKVADYAWNVANGIGLGSWTSGAGTVTSADNVLTALQKIDGNVAAHAALSSNPHSVTKAQILTAEKIINADVDAAAAIVESKLSLDYSTSSLNTAIAAAQAASNAVAQTETCGEAFAANQVWCVRFAKQGEAAGKIFKGLADSIINSDIFGFIEVAGVALAIDDTISVKEVGDITLGSSDSAFNAADINKPVFLHQTTSGKFTVSPTTVSGDYLKRVGTVKTTGIFKARIETAVQA